jgi:hypothetical protein
MDGGVEPTLAVSSWRGPERANHDFQFTNGSIEVKATVAATPVTVRISNVRQLDDSGLDALILVVLVMDEAESGQSLSSIIDDLGQRIPETASFLWTDRLTAAGYLEVQREIYQSPGYLVRELRFYRVAPGFPRLLDPDLPEGVSEVSYSVSLTALRPYQCDGLEAITPAG